MVGSDLAVIGEACVALQAALGRGILVVPPSSSLNHPDPSRRSPPPWHPNAFDAGRDLGYVAGVRGLLEYSVRHLPRLLAATAMTAGDDGALRAWLGGLVSAARRLAASVRSRRGTATSSPSPGRPSGSGNGPAPEGMAYGVSVEQSPGGPDNRLGTYIVVYTVGTPSTVTVRSRCTYALPAGHYVYIGSAFNSGGVKARVSWHLDPTKPPLKNVDFLKPFARPIETWWSFRRGEQECPWSALMAAKREYHCPAPKFGAIDCLICPANLYFTEGPPDIYEFALRLVPGHARCTGSDWAPASGVSSTSSPRCKSGDRPTSNGWPGRGTGRVDGGSDGGLRPWSS